MQALAERPNYAADADVQALAADAVMSLAPWALYGADQAPTPVAVRAKAPLERGLAADPAHPYLCHLRVHLDEMGPRARFHWPSAEALRRTDATDAGHLLHMPSHLDIQVGDYSAAMQANREAISADLRQLARAPQRFSIYSGYVVHNMEFLAWAAMLAGNKGAALAAAGQIETFLDEARLASNPMLPAFFESYLATRPMVASLSAAGRSESRRPQEASVARSGARAVWALGGAPLAAPARGRAALPLAHPLPSFRPRPGLRREGRRSGGPGGAGGVRGSAHADGAGHAAEAQHDGRGALRPDRSCGARGGALLPRGPPRGELGRARRRRRKVRRDAVRRARRLPDASAPDVRRAARRAGPPRARRAAVRGGPRHLPQERLVARRAAALPRRGGARAAAEGGRGGAGRGGGGGRRRGARELRVRAGELGLGEATGA
mmetsp:Transcript_3953/g.11466  ORF Transcript_3953/g.11466 Transcript_3953/m.11466 type:complete len:436 (-) Transcript_3953:236-1543(-)